MKVVILAGGEGSRLAPYTDVVPKALLEVGGKPIVERLLERLSRYRFKEVLLCINEEFENRFEYLSLPPWNVKLSVSPRPMGTAGELYHGANNLSEDPFLVHYVDEITTIDFSAFVDCHWKFQSMDNNYAGTLALVKGIPLEVSKVRTRGHLIERFEEKPRIDAYTWAGIGILSPKILDYCEPESDLGADVFPAILEDGYRLCAYKSSAHWHDIGQVHNLRLVDNLIDEGKLDI